MAHIQCFGNLAANFFKKIDGKFLEKLPLLVSTRQVNLVCEPATKWKLWRVFGQEACRGILEQLTTWHEDRRNPQQIRVNLCPRRN